MSGGYFDLLRREGDFRRVYISELISLGGDWFALVPLLILLPKLTGSALWGGLVIAADTLVLALLSPYAGTVVDRLDRRKIMIVADLVSAVSILLLLLVRDSATAWIALAAIGLVAGAKAFYSPAVSAAIPNLVESEDLAKANVINGAAWGTMLAVGAGLGGLMADLVGPAACFVIDACSFLLSAWLTARTTKPFGQARAPREPSVRKDLRETVAYARTDHRVLGLLAAKVGPGMGNGATALYPLFVSQVFRVTESGTGFLFTARGIGALVGPFIMRSFVSRAGGRLFPALAISMALFGAGYVALGLVPWFWLALGVVLLAHLGGGANWILSTYGLQSIVPDDLRGRVFGVDYMVATFAVAVSQVIAGVLSEHLSPGTVSIGLGSVVVAYSVAWFVLTSRMSRAATPPETGET